MMMDLPANESSSSQTRFRPKSAQGFCQAEEVTCGGNFLPFYAAVRLKLIRKNLIMNEDKVNL